MPLTGRILVVEDDVAIRTSLADMLRESGHSVVRLKPTHDVGESELLALWHSVLEHAETH